MLKDSGHLFKLAPLFLFMTLAACGGGGSGGDTAITGTATSISGGGVKGPLANAVVTVYDFDPTQVGFKGGVVSTASTDTTAAIAGLSLPVSAQPPYIMEFTSDGSTTDITTGRAPVIGTMRTVVTASMLADGVSIYATPLTTMAVDIAVEAAVDTDSSGAIDASEFEAALAVAATQVASTLGFGMPSSIDIFETPPLINASTTTAQSQGEVAAYRTAVEALTAVLYEVDQRVAGSSTEGVLSEMAVELASGNDLDGGANGAVIASVLQQDPASLPIPNTDPVQTVGDIQGILVSEKAVTLSSTDTTEIEPGGSVTTKPEPAETSPDTDGDGVLNVNDAMPLNPDESSDADNDGIGDFADPDDDNNGVLDQNEGITAVVTATDADGDGVDDAADNCPAVINPTQTDTDSDSAGDACDTDMDGDGVSNGADSHPMDPSKSVDTDGDGIDDSVDLDDDNDGVDDVTENSNGSNPLLKDTDGDGVYDNADAFPLNPSESIDSDGDATGDNADPDDDNDGLTDAEEIAAGTKPLVADTDGDGANDGIDVFPLNPIESDDTDGDGIGDNTDAFPSDPTETVDTDGDGVGDNTDAFPSDPMETVDTDGDGVGDNTDNCIAVANADQADSDSDGIGDVCEGAGPAFWGNFNWDDGSTWQ